MPTITKEEYEQRVAYILNKYETAYNSLELDFIKANVKIGSKKAFTVDVLRQIQDETGWIDDRENMYEGFVKLVVDNFDINQNIIEIGGGVIPSIAKRLALRQKNGSVTVYDPRLITDMHNIPNLILKKEKFDENTPVGNTSLIISFMPCEATNPIIDTACRNNIDFMVGLCEGGSRPGYEYLETDDEWISHVKYNAEKQMEKTNMGILLEASLAQYDNPYPVIYNKRRKS